MARHPISDQELILYGLNGLGSEYEYVVVHLTHFMQIHTLQDVQYELMMHETRLEQQNTLSQILISNSLANIVYNNNNSNRSNSNGREVRGRRGRNNRLYCHLCQSQGHDTLKCHKIFDIY